MPQEFPLMHLYALLAAAVAVMNMFMGRQTYDSDHGWLERWSPLLPVVLAVLHPYDASNELNRPGNERV